MRGFSTELLKLATSKSVASSVKTVSTMASAKTPKGPTSIKASVPKPTVKSSVDYAPSHKVAPSSTVPLQDFSAAPKLQQPPPVRI